MTFLVSLNELGEIQIFGYTGGGIQECFTILYQQANIHFDLAMRTLKLMSLLLSSSLFLLYNVYSIRKTKAQIIKDKDVFGLFGLKAAAENNPDLNKYLCKLCEV